MIKVINYLGIDYSKNFIDIANENYQYENCYFQEMSAVDIDINKLFILNYHLFNICQNQYSHRNEKVFLLQEVISYNLHKLFLKIDARYL